MFEGLIEKILLSYFGKYINDINKSDLSLGIMQGDFTIQNVSLKSEIMQLVDLPLELKFSFIEKLMIQIPWKQIFSQPVKITISNLFATVTPKEEWDLSKIHSFETKQQQIEAFVRKLIEKKAEQSQNPNSNDKRGASQNNIQANGGSNNQGNVSKKEGFIDRIMARIIDNVQIVITNMHLRFEYTLEKPYFSWGIFLESLKIQTMEEDFQTPKFFNRSAKGNKNKPIYKLVELKKLTAYWNTHETDLWNQKDARKQKHRMHDLVQGNRKADQLIQVHLNAKITINLDKEGWRKPELEVSVDFNEINIHISNRQLQDLLKLIDLFNQYHNALEIESARYKQYFPDPNNLFNYQLDELEKNRLHDEFQKYHLYPLIRRYIKRIRFKAYFIEIFNSKRPIKDVLSQEKYEEYENILVTTDLDDLQEWVTTALNFNEKQKSTGIASYFSYLKFWETGSSSQQQQQQGGGNSSPSTGSGVLGYIKDQVRQQKMQEFQPTNEDQSEHPPNYISFRFTLSMMKGSAKISRHARNNTLEEMVCTWNDLQIHMDKSRSKNHIGMKILNIGIALNTIIRNQKSNEQEGKQGSQAVIANDKLNSQIKISGHKKQNPFQKNIVIPQSKQKMKGLNQLDHQYTNKTIQEEEEQRKQHLGDSFNSEGQEYPNQEQESKSIQLMKKGCQDNKESLVDFEIDFEKNLQTDQVQSIILKCHIQSTEFIYYPTTLKQILQLFQINKQQYQRINLLALKKFDKIQQQSMKGLEGMFEGEKTIDVLVNIKSPFIVVPFHMKKNSECWLLDLGDILMTYHEQQQGEIAEKKYYDQVSITVDNIQMLFYSTLDMCNEYLKKQTKDEKNNFIQTHINSFKIANIIEEFSVSLDIYVRKKRAETQNFAKLKMMASLQSIKLNLSEYNLKKLFELIKLFQELDDEYSQQVLIEEKKHILDQSIKIGVLCKRGNTYKSWSEVSAVLSEQYLYLYQTPEKVNYMSYINVAGYDISQCSEQEVGVMHSFKLQERRGKKEIHYFYCSDAQSLQDWMSSIKKVININIQLDIITAMMMGGGTVGQLTQNTEEDQKQGIGSYNNLNKENTSINYLLNDSNNNINNNFESIQLDQISDEKSTRTISNIYQQSPPSFSIESMNIHVTFTSIELKVYKTQADRQWINIKLEGLKAQFSQRPLDFSVQVTLNAFVLEDFIFDYPFRSLHPILQSTPILQKSTGSVASNASVPFSMQLNNTNNNKGVFSGNSKSSKTNNRNLYYQNKYINKPFLKVEFKQIEKSHPYYKKSNSDLIIKVEIKEIYANWKPEQIRDIINFFMEKKVKEKEERFLKERGRHNGYDDVQYKYSNRNRQLNTRSNFLQKQAQIKTEQVSNQSTLLKIVVEIDQLNLYLINHYHKNHNLLCSLQASSTSLSIDFKEYELLVSCAINDLIAQDGMNYPYTRPGWSDKQNAPEKKQFVFGQKKDQKGEKVFHMNFSKLDEGHPELVNSIFNKLELNFQNLELSYFQQPILRLIDYILEQLLPVCTDEYDLPKVMKEDPVELLRRITNPKFTDMKINLNDISVLLKATPAIQNFIRLQASKINIYSSPYQNEKRLLKSPNSKLKDVWAEKMNIDIVGAQLFYKSEFMLTEKPISNVFDYNLQIDRAIFRQEYHICYPNKIEIDTQIVITGKIDHLKIKLLREEYLCMMRFLFNNVLFDDYEDAQYFSNYDVNKNNPPNPLIYSLNFDFLTLEIHDLFEEITEDQQFNNFGNLYDRPLISLTLQGSSLSFNKTPIRKNTFLMNAQRIIEKQNNIKIGYNISNKYDKERMVYFIQGFYDTLEEYEVPINQDNEFIIDYVFEQEQIKQLMKVKSNKQHSSPLKKSSLVAGFPSIISNIAHAHSEDHSESSNKFTLNCVINPDGHKEIDITLTNFQLLFGIGFLFNVINFSFMDDSVTVVQPPKKVNPSPMILILDIKNVQLYIQGPSKEYSLACLGKFQISFIKNESQDKHDIYHQELEMNEDIPMEDSSVGINLIHNKNHKQGLQFSPCSTMKINVSDLELYTHRFNSGNNSAQQNCQPQPQQQGHATNRSGVYGNNSNLHFNQQHHNKHGNNQHSGGGGNRINLVNPCTIIYVSSNYSCFCNEQNLKYFNQTNLDIQKIRCRFSYKDLAIVNETSLLQTQQMQKVRTFSEKLFNVSTFQNQQLSPNLNAAPKFYNKNISTPNLPQIANSGQYNSMMLAPSSHRPSMQFQQLSYNLYGKSAHNIYNNTNNYFNQNILVEDSDSIQSQFQDYQIDCEEVQDESECQSEEHQPESQVILSQSPKDIGEYNFINHRNSTTLKESTQLQNFSQQNQYGSQQTINYKTQSVKSNKLSFNQQLTTTTTLKHTQSAQVQSNLKQTRKIPIQDNKLSYSMSIQDISPNIHEKKFVMDLSNVNSPAHFAAKTHYDMINNIKKAMIDKAQQNYNTQSKNVQTYNYSEKKFTIDGIEIIIINNIGDSYLPVLHTNLILGITISSEQDRSLLDGYVTLGVSYYNPYVGRMEPILEESQFQINLVRGEKANPKFFFILEQVSENLEDQEDKSQKMQQQSQKKDSIIRLTISDTMLGILMNAFQEWQKYIELIRQNNLQFYEVNQTQEEQKHKQKMQNQKNLLRKDLSKEIGFKKKESVNRGGGGYEISRLGSLKENEMHQGQDKIKTYDQNQIGIGGFSNTAAAAVVGVEANQRFQDKITLFSIINETGYRFVSYRKQEKIEDIKEENNFKFDITVDSNEEDFSHTFNREVYLDIFFEDIKGIQHTIKNVKINRQKVVKYNWWVVDFVEGNRVECKDKYFIQNVQVKDNKTMLIISSPYLFYNITQQYISFNLDNFEKTQMFNIAPSEKHPIPFEYIAKESTEFTMFFSNPKYVNDKLSIPSLPVQIQSLIKLQETDMLEVKHTPFTSYFKTVNDKYFVGRVLFIIEPILQFKNALPKKLILDIYYENNINAPQINQNNLQTINNQDPFQYRISNSINTSNLSLDHMFQNRGNNMQQVFLEKQQVFEVHCANYNQIVKIQISIEGMEKSEKVLIFSQDRIRKLQTIQEKVDIYEYKDNDVGYMEDDFNMNPIPTQNHHDGNHYTEIDDENNFASNTVQRARNKNLEKFITVHMNIDVTTTHPQLKPKSKENVESKNVHKNAIDNLQSQIIPKAKRVFVCFYVKTVLVNSSLFNNIIFYDFDQQKPRMLVGQSSQFSSQEQKILLMNQEKTLMFSKYDSQYASNEVSIKGIGHTFIDAKIPVSYREKDDAYELYEMGIDVKLIQSLPKQKIYTKLIHINPKYVIINNTGFDIDICQYKVGDKPVQMKKDQKRLAWYWKDCTKEKQMCVRINESYLKQVTGDTFMNSIVEWSGPFSIESIRAVHTFCKIKDKPLTQRATRAFSLYQTTQDVGTLYQSQNLQLNEQDIEYFENQLQMEKIFFQASVNINKSTYFIVLESKDLEKDFGYGLLNQCSNIQITVQQNLIQLSENDAKEYEAEDDSINNEIFQLNYNQQVSFAWKYPDNKPEIRITFSIIQPTTENQIENFGFTQVANLNSQKHVEIINLFNFQNQKDISFKFNGNTQKVRIQTQFKKNTKILSFKPINDVNINQVQSKQSIMDSQHMNEEKQYLQQNTYGGGSASNRKANELSLKNQLKLADMEKISETQEGGEQDHSDGEKNSIQKVICIHLKNVGISFITRTKKQNRELNYITLKGLIFEMHEKETSTQTNIDNNSSRKTFTPVNLTPSSNKLLQSNSANFFEFILERDHKDSSILVINSLKAYLFPTTIKIDEEYLDHLLEAIQSIRNNLNAENQLTINKKMELTHFLFPNDEEKCTKQIINLIEQKYLQNNEQIKQVTDKCLYEWQYDDIPEMKKFIYIKEMILHKIQINISFHNRIVQDQENKGHKKFVALNVIADALGTAFRNIDEAPVKLSGFQIEDQFGTTPNIIHKIREHYKQCVISALFSVLGSVEIIGNPINLYRRIKQGVEDFALKPLDGLRNEGFVGFGVGMMEGTGSLLKNSLAGTCYSLNKFSGSLASGLSIISSDNEFIEARKKLMLNKPRHVIQGLQQAGMCIYKGLEGALKGVVMHPYRGGVDDGVTGFLKGTLKGVSGVFTKPLSGALDATAKTAEGLTSIFTVYEDKSRDQRMRLPRILYEKTQYFKEIQEKEEKIVEFLWETFDENQDIEVIDTFVVKEPIQGRKNLSNKKKYITKILILLKNRIFYLNTDKKVTEFDIFPHEILQFDSKTEASDPNTILIQIKTTQEKAPKIIKYRRKQHENNQIVEKLKYLTELIE